MSVNWCETCRKYTNNCGCSTNANQGTGQFVNGFYVIRGENLSPLESGSGGSSSNGSGASGNGTSNGASNGTSNRQSNGNNSNGNSNGSSRRQ
ncbi:uncharacterized protein PpBr36_06584 [Pyricularia pennisetigena]|uniref:uncharacterized protein n=1 Tax=Pyricularia pennisetigena TaxID=1578925 RepID=UPI00114EC920|nr:uncharacterized protein PpBr36_06584 [Pyricularia pennisetigena]TLS23583.1 hypothetical protein PpBr36_06584 [Pyricularia pennisetigena]